MQYIYLSHILDDIVPVYGSHRASLHIKSIKARSRGDSANVYSFSMENHWGTHIDTPAHFFDGTPPISQFRPENWLFIHPQVIEITVQEKELIGVEEFKLASTKFNDSTDLLLIKTGFQQWRGTERYSLENPGIKAEVGFWLRERCTSLRAIGFDFISLSSFENRSAGREAHRAFLDPRGSGKPILIIEDMDLNHDLKHLQHVWAIPLRLKDLDSSPCTVIGMLE